MGRRIIRVTILALVVGLLGPAQAVAHSDEDGGISCEPSMIGAGGTVVLAGTGLEPDSDRAIQLVGADMIVVFPTVTTDAEGMFNVTITVPAHLPAGSYRFEAIGDETLTTDLVVTAGSEPVARGSDNEPTATTPRDRSGLELAIIGAFLLLAVAGGLFLVLRAERFGRTEPPA